MELAAERGCGDCLACCKEPTIRDAALDKPPGVLCPHHTGGGCGIYETRPEPCRAFFCGWRYLARLDEDWRPDRSGILLMFSDDDVPAAYPKRPGMQLHLTKPQDDIDWKRVLGLIASLIASDVPLFISVPGVPGEAAQKSFLNTNMAAAIASRDYGAALSALKQHIEACRQASKAAVRLA